MITISQMVRFGGTSIDEESGLDTAFFLSIILIEKLLFLPYIT
jgi:hypothetical protein